MYTVCANASTDTAPYAYGHLLDYALDLLRSSVTSHCLEASEAAVTYS